MQTANEFNINSQYLYIITVSKYNINLKAYSFSATDDNSKKIRKFIKKIHMENFSQILLDKTNLLVYDETYICNQQAAINNIDESINISKEKLSEYCFNFTELNQNMVQYSDKQIAMLKGITSKLDRLISLLKNTTIMALVAAQAKFDTETGQIFWYDLDGNALNIKPNKTVKSKAVKTDDFDEYDVIVGPSSLKLSKQALELLAVNAGDRVRVGIKTVDNILTPFIAKAEDTSEGANLLSKSNTVQCRGKNMENLLKFGDKFKLKQTSDGTFTLVGGKEVQQPTSDPGIEIIQDDDAIINDLNKLGEENKEEVKEISIDELINFLDN